MHFLNPMFFFMQRVLGILKCRHRSISLSQCGLDPRITRFINKVGFEGLFCIPNLIVDHALITALVECWHSETHTFHLPHREMGITLQDIEEMLGVPMDGFPVVGKTNLIWKDMCMKFLGFTPPPSVPHPNENKTVLARARIQINWLAKQFRVPLVANAYDIVMQRYAHYHILV